MSEHWEEDGYCGGCPHTDDGYPTVPWPECPATHTPAQIHDHRVLVAELAVDHAQRQVEEARAFLQTRERKVLQATRDLAALRQEQP